MMGMREVTIKQCADTAAAPLPHKTISWTEKLGTFSTSNLVFRKNDRCFTTVLVFRMFLNELQVAHNCFGALQNEVLVQLQV